MKKFCFFLLLSVAFSPLLLAQSWTATESPTDEPLNSIYFVDKHTGWAVGENGTILHTSDGGDSWDIQNGRTTEHLHDLFFFDELTGWIAGDESTLLFTNDGGNTWSDRRPLSVPGQHLYGVYFVDWKRGWTAGGPGNFIYYTDDAGLTWSRKFSTTGDMNFHSIQFIDHNRGFAADSANVYYTENSGEDWQQFGMPQHIEITTLQDFFAVHDSLLFVLANTTDKSLLLKTSNRGGEWDLIHQTEQQKLTSVFFTDNKSGWVAGSNGVLSETQNGGDDWTKVEPLSSGTLQALHFSDTMGWAANSNGEIFRLSQEIQLSPPPFKTEYPNIQIADETEAIELLNRVLDYLRGPELYSKPTDRSPYFHRIRGAISSVQHYFKDKDKPESVSERIHEIITSYWAEEHNKGTELLSEIDVSDNPVKSLIDAGNHFKNAILLQPDSTQSYKTLSFVFEDLGQIDNAIRTYRQIIEITSDASVDDYEYLTDLYLLNDKFDKAFELSSEALELFPESIFFREVIAEYHVQENNTDAAINSLRELIERSPKTARYRISRASQSYSNLLSTLEESLSLQEEIWRLREDLFADLPPQEEQRVQQEIERKLQQIDDLNQRQAEVMTQIVTDLETVIQLYPDHERAHSLLGTISHSRASLYIEKITLTHEPDEIESFEQKIESDLQRAQTNLEIAVDLNPGNAEYRQTLYEVYMRLGMDNRASEIRSQF